MKCFITILAAGKGTRMKSPLPKVLHEAAGRPLIDLVLDRAEEIVAASSIQVVIGHGGDQVRKHLQQRNPAILSVVQEPQLGTGDALRVAMEALKNQEPEAVLVLSGDVPLLKTATLHSLLTTLETGAEAVLLTAVLPEPGSYGRILRNSSFEIEEIVEAKDADPRTLAIREVNAGVYAFRTASLRRALAGLRPENVQAEYYLTDVIASLRRQQLPVKALCLEDPMEMAGVNTPEDLVRVSRRLEVSRRS